MRLIDADKLKEEVNKKNVVGRFNTIMLIDDAPTVFSCNACKNMGNEWECRDCHDYSNYVHYEEQPQGEWIKGEEIAKGKIGNKEFSEYRNFTCSSCGVVLDNLLYWSDGSPFYKFCPNCGAKMREGGAK